MKYRLENHDRETAVLDMLIALLPDEKHCADDGLGGDICISSLEACGEKITARAEIHRVDTVSFGECEENAPLEGEERKRIISYAVKTALFKALLPHLDEPPAWGSLTGVKPAKPVRVYMQEGHSEEEAKEWLMSRYFVSPDRSELCTKAALAALEAEGSLRDNEVQLYLGIPFCPTKCAYCSFVSNDMTRWGHLIEPYTQCLVREVKAAGEMLKREGKTVGSVYIGGGTPTTLTELQLELLLSSVREHIPMDFCREFTVEAGRPETITEEKLLVMSRFGVDRISINPQSMNDKVLEGVGRKHTSKDIIDTYRLARKTGNFVINMDLIAGLPGDDGEGLLESTSCLIELEPDNITVHCLARKKGAPMRFGKRGELEKSELDACYELLSRGGYEPYYLYRQKYSAGGLENTGFCKNDKKSHYNICMMEEIGDVVALGSGGISKLCTNGGQKIVRVNNPKYPIEYVERIESIIEKKLNITL